MTLGQRIIAWRESRGFERVQVASRMCEAGRKTNEHDLWRWEAGRNKPDIDALNVIAQVFGINLDDLVNGLPTEYERIANGSSKPSWRA